MNLSSLRLKAPAAQIGIGLTLAAIWLYFQGGYQGLIHDARLYALLALEHLHPQIFEHDLFAGTGSQGNFTLFPAIHARFISIFGLNNATLLLTMAGLAAWFGTLTTLVRRVVPGWGWALAILCIISGTRFYDPDNVFISGEAFLTPRIFAEAFSFLAIAWLLHRHYLRALASITCALLCHPLMAVYPLSAGFLIFLLDAHIPRRWRMASAFIAIAVLTLLTVARISVFARLFTSYDAQWLALVQLRSPWQLPTNWDADFAGRVVFMYAVLLIGWRLSGSLIARQVFPIIAASLLLLGVGVIGSTLWHDQLLIQLQLWRNLWLLQIFSTTELACLLWQRWHGNTADRWLAALLTAGWLQAGGLTGGVFNNGWLACACTVAGVLIYHALRHLSAPIARHRLLGVVPWLIPLPNLLSNLRLALSLSAYSATVPDALSWHVMQLAALTALAGVFLIWLILARRSPATAFSWVISALGAMVFMTSLTNWSEPAWRTFGKTSDAPPPPIRALQARIPEGALVLADRDVTWTWFTLGRSAYVSNTQLAAIGLSHDIAMTGARRMRHTCTSGFPNCGRALGLSYEDSEAPSLQGKHLSREEIRTLCEAPDLDIALLSGHYAQMETFPDEKGRPLALVDCGKLRAEH